MHLILSLSPVCNVGKPWSIEDKFQFPTDNSFLHVPLSLRYRSTRNLQKFTEHVGIFKKNFLTGPSENQGDVPFSSGSVIEGELPEWTDLGNDRLKVFSALERIKEDMLGEHDEVVLLLHSEEDDNRQWNMLRVEGFLDYITKPRRNGGYGWQMVDYGEFQGAESDVIIYLGPGGIEGLTRAKRKLFIVTYHRGGIQK